MIYHLGLGSNLGDRAGRLSKARAALAEHGVKIRAASSLYETEPLGFREQPWFVNQAVEVESALSPHKLLRLVKRVEKAMGRTAARRDGPRVIDLDILLAEDTVVRTEELTIPHPRLTERNFVLVPLAEIAPQAVHPVLNKKIREVLRCSKDKSKIRPFLPLRRDST